MFQQVFLNPYFSNLASVAAFFVCAVLQAFIGRIFVAVDFSAGPATHDVNVAAAHFMTALVTNKDS